MLRFLGKSGNNYILQNEETLLVSFCKQETCCRMLHNNFVINGLQLIGFQLVEEPQSTILPEQFTGLNNTAKRFCYDLVRGGFDIRNATYNTSWLDSQVNCKIKYRISLLRKLYTTVSGNVIGHKLSKRLRVAPKLDKYFGKVPVATISTGILGTIKKGYICYDSEGKLYEVLLFLA